MTPTIRAPQTEAEFEQYFEFRWQLLRQPWDQPRGSERDEFENSAHHLAAWDEDNRVVAVGRLHLIGDDQAQVRYMATAKTHQGCGLGRAILQKLELVAAEQNVGSIQLNARNQAMGFYQRQGYQVLGPAHHLFGSIPHSKLCKTL